MNYDKQEDHVAFSDVMDSAGLDDENRGLKLSHHPDGFLQFSGDGVVSGLDADGQPRGVGVMSWAFARPAFGPSFGLSIFNVHRFAADPGGRPEDVVFSEEEIHPIPGWTSLHVEGYYLPPLWRRFTQLTPQGDYRLQLAHPSGAVLTLKVTLAPSDCAVPGLIGLECYTDYGEHGAVGDDAGLIISGSTGNLRREDGHLLGDGIYAIVPPGGIPTRRSANFTPPA